MAGTPSKNAISQAARKAGKKAWSMRPKGGMAMAAGNIALDSVYHLKQGSPLGPALIKALPETLAWATMPGVMWSAMGGYAAAMGIQGYIKGDQRLQSKYVRMHTSNPQFQAMDTREAATMRQAAVQAIQGSKLNARNALGGEARLMHRGYGDRMGV